MTGGGEKTPGLDAVSLRREIAAGRRTSLETAQMFLERIRCLDGKYGAFVTVSVQRALERAERLDAKRASGGHHAAAASDMGSFPLWGMPFADKDLVARAGVRTTYGSLAFADHIPEKSDPLAERMDRAGGVSLGKTSTSEFGLAGYARSRILESRNPWDRDRDPGGSSGGAAVAVAARMLPFAPGSDGGGSLRIPAAACGLVGLKPSRGRVPGYGGCDSPAGLVVAGPIARTTADAALLLDGMLRPGGADGRTSSLRAPEGPPAGYLAALAVPPEPLRLAWSTWTPWREAYPDIEAGREQLRVFEETVRHLERLGHRVEPAPDPISAGYPDAFAAIWQASAAAIPLDERQRECTEHLTRWLISAGRSRHAGDLVRALAVLARCEHEIIAAFAPYDAVLTPALGEEIWLLEDFGARGEEAFEAQCRLSPYTSYVNVAGLPAISMPVGAASDGQLPIGVQAIGRIGDEVTLLRLARQLERDLRWDQRTPPGLELPTSGPGGR